jgi:hypothetical protein
MFVLCLRVYCLCLFKEKANLKSQVGTPVAAFKASTNSERPGTSAHVEIECVKPPLFGITGVGREGTYSCWFVFCLQFFLQLNLPMERLEHWQPKLGK